MERLSQIPARGMQSQPEAYNKMSKPAHRNRANVHMNGSRMGENEASLATNDTELSPASLCCCIIIWCVWIVD